MGLDVSKPGPPQSASATRAFAALYASPQLRAVETAEILRGEVADLPIIVAPLIDEIDCYFEGHPMEEVGARGWDLYTGVDDGEGT